MGETLAHLKGCSLLLRMCHDIDTSSWRETLQQQLVPVWAYSQKRVYNPGFTGGFIFFFESRLAETVSLQQATRLLPPGRIAIISPNGR